LTIPFNVSTDKFIIFSDQHKGARNGADDFAPAASNYLKALAYYNHEDFFYINLGDCEELWENNIWQVKKYNKVEFEAEKKFLVKEKFVKLVGNHDLFWTTSPWAYWHLKSLYGEAVKVYEGIILEAFITEIVSGDEFKTGKPLRLLLSHGHQGDGQSDGNWFSKFFVGWIWAPLQSLLRINPNTPSNNNEKKTLHNDIMYEWSSNQQNMLLVTGHTHQPVFQSLTILEKLYKEFQFASKGTDKGKVEEIVNTIKKIEKEFTAVSVDYMTMKPTYFNTGCCCFSDGDITGIEIAEGSIRLIKWSFRKGREILEERKLEELMKEI